MLIPKKELEYDFKGATFDLGCDADRRLLGWVFNQFLYGEVTGIQCGHWLYKAPHLSAASFLARQASEELAHVRKILRILTLLEVKPAPAHWAIRFMATGMMGGSWGEHVALEMALGEGLVLTIFYAMAQTIDQPEIRKLIESAAADEERHVEFGERETQAWLRRYPGSRGFLMGSALLQYWALQRLRNFVERKVVQKTGADHPVLKHLGSFYDHSVRMFEVRMMRLGLTDQPLSELGLGSRARLLAQLPFGKLKAKFAYRNALLTSTYLDDPVTVSEQSRDRLPS